MKVFCLSSPLLHYLNIVLHVPQLLCSFSLFWLILGFDGALSYQGVFITHPICSYQCPSWSQSFAVTCTALGQPKLNLPHSLQLRGLALPVLVVVACAVWAEGELQQKSAGFQCQMCPYHSPDCCRSVTLLFSLVTREHCSSFVH